MNSKLRTMFKMLIKNPKKLIRGFGSNGLLNWVPDKLYLSMVYYAEMDKKLNLNNPKSFNEKLQWLKLNDRRPEHSMYVDKYEVRKHISNIIGEGYLIPMIGVYDTVEEIDWDALPNKFVLKCTHGSHCNIICKDKSKLNIEESTKRLNKWMNYNWYWFGREWPYKNIKPRIICEEFMTDDRNDDLKDYKLFSFNGKVKCILVCADRNSEVGMQMDFYDKHWNKINCKRPNKSNIKSGITKPSTLDEMIELAELLSKDMPFVRVDFYDIDGKLYFGELTFYPASGLEKFEPESYDELFGSWIELPS